MGYEGITRVIARLKMPLPADDNRYRRVIIETCCRIHQLRVRLLGISEIRSKYEPIWKESEELSLYCKFLSNLLFLKHFQHHYPLESPAFLGSKIRPLTSGSMPQLVDLPTEDSTFLTRVPKVLSQV
ncbi:hypothetical protein POJ06DRAFT_90165 [Lipomyces tetrasporus]|uniref:DDE Tnp4 domain-containing protein n=1 Tax=Lipomyces tetrasporus TaxID=54092 RepID=A0AAD7QTE4_9ASCO|nr:uncharacterized protein POJ06DRAFT_90165 [Lipomyces tetrasporus]KAJ8101172.1 hypothetical protein POJ06DRAFT_90165 [Lipomyces tetrasporus]